MRQRFDTCYTCRHWLGFGVRERGPKGQCRRYPPMATSRSPGGSFPVTNLTDWCGEWQRATGHAVHSDSDDVVEVD